jgi:hypothetical protein
MASPYALDFSPVTNALDNSRQHALALQQQEMARNKLGMEQERLGFEREMQPFKVAQMKQANDTGALEYEGALAKRFAGLSQMMDAESDEAKRTDMLRKIYASDPRIQSTLGKHLPAELINDPVAVSRYWTAVARGYRDPLDTRAKEVGISAKEAEAGKDTAQAGLFTSQASNAKVQVNPVTGQYYNQKGPLPEQPGQSNQGALIFGKEFAKSEAPKLYAESSKLYTDAADTHNIMSTLEELAPHARTGFAGPQLLQLRKLGTSLGIKDDSIAPTELFQFLAQKGVFELTKQLKPASNLDMIASERATASLQSDPSTLPLALPVLKAVAQRSMLRHQLEMEFYKRGMPPDSPGIMAEVNRQVPLDLSGVTKAQNGPPGGPQVTKPNTSPLPAAPPIGTIKTGRDGVPYRFKGGNPADSNSWERAQ